MKKRLFTLFTILGLTAFAQQEAPPQGINYQAVVYSDNGNNQPGLNSPGQVLWNEDIGVQFSILSGSATGTVIYKETHATSTDEFGMFNLVIGQGLVQGTQSFNMIDWGSGYHFLKVEVDKTGGTDYLEMSNQQLWSVPYALYSGYSSSSGYADSAAYADIAGNGLTGVSDNGDGTLTFTYYDGSTYTTAVLSGLGSVGPQGPAGADGQDGLSAYEIWLAQGNTGSEQDFLNSLEGPQGPAGNGISNTTDNGDGTFTITYSDGSTFTTSNLTGPQGTPGSLDAWSLTGNAGTDPTTNFIGTTDAQDWVVKTNNSERMRVTSGGNLGLGVISPSSRLDLFTNHNFNYAVKIQNGGGAGQGLLVKASAGSENPIIFNVQDNYNNDRFSVLGLGNVGVGTSSPLGKFHVNNDVTGADSSFVVTTGGKVGIGTDNPNYPLQIHGTVANLATTSNESLRIFLDNNSQLRFTERLNYVGDSTQIDINPMSLNSSSTADIRFFRETNTTGPKAVYFLRGNNTSERSAKIGIDGQSSYFQLQGGGVGIGTDNPQGKLHVVNTNGNMQFTDIGAGYFERAGGTPLILRNTDNNSSNNIGHIEFRRGTVSGTSAFITTTSNGSGSVSALGINFGGSNKLRVLSNGNVGIGTLAPDQLLSVNGNASKAGGGSWATFSDRRVKYDITPFKDGLDVLMQLSPVTFKYNEKSGYTDINKTFVGFIAQDVETVAPYMVNLYDDTEGPSGLSDKRQFDESALNKILVNAVQEQQKQIELLKKELEELKAIIKK